MFTNIMCCNFIISRCVCVCVLLHRQCMTVPPSQRKVILCTHFCQLVSGLRHPSPQSLLTTPHRSSTPPPVTSSSSGHRHSEGLCQVHSTHKSPTPHTLTNSPTQVRYFIYMYIMLNHCLCNLHYDILHILLCA